MSRDEWAYKAVNLHTGDVCPHIHHSKESAERCADLEGWIRYKVKRMPSHPPHGSKRAKIRDRRKALRMERTLTCIQRVR